MKRISLLMLGLWATAWASGCCCCHGYYTRYAECDEGYAMREPRVRGRQHRHHRRDKGEKCDVDGNCGDYMDNCCDPCCDGSVGGGPALPMSPSTYDNSGAMLPGAPSGGCAACGTTQSFGGTPLMYGGMPFDPGSGWTIQSTTSTPVGNEPVLAPPSSQAATPITPAAPKIQGQGWAPSPSSAPSPGPVPPPVSYNRQ